MEHSHPPTNCKRKRVEEDKLDMAVDSHAHKAKRMRLDEEAKAQQALLDDLLIDVEILGLQYRDTWRTDERTSDIKKFGSKCWWDLDHDMRAVQVLQDHAKKHWDRCDVDDFTRQVDLLDFGKRMYLMVNTCEEDETKVKKRKKKPAKDSASRAQKRKEPAAQPTSTKSAEPDELPAKRRKVDAKQPTAKEMRSRERETEVVKPRAPAVTASKEREKTEAKPHPPAGPASKEQPGQPHRTFKPHVSTRPVDKDTERVQNVVKPRAPAAQKKTSQLSTARKALSVSKRQLKAPDPSSIKPQYWVTRPPAAKEPEMKKPDLGYKSSIPRDTAVKKPDHNQTQSKTLETKGLNPKKTESQKSNMTNEDPVKEVSPENHKKADTQASLPSKPTPSAPVKQPNLLRRTVKRPPIIMRPIPRPKPKKQ